MERSRSGKLRGGSMVLVLAVTMLLGGCGDEMPVEQSQQNFSSQSFSNTLVPSSTTRIETTEDDKEDKNAENDKSEDGFVRDYEEAEKNKWGNSVVNLTMTGSGGRYRSGKVTGQGKWAYYFKDGEIRKIDEQGNIYVVCSAKRAHSLNVVGDYIYYISGGSMYKVRTDGAMQTEMMKNVDDQGSILVVEDAIYYVATTQISSEKYTFEIQKYDMVAMEKTIFPVKLGTNRPQLVGVYDDQIYYTYVENDVRKWVVINNRTSEISEYENETTARFIVGEILVYASTKATGWGGTGAPYEFNLKLYSLKDGKIKKDLLLNTQGSHVVLRSVYEDNIIMQIDRTKLYLVDSIDEHGYSGACIVEESEQFDEVYVIGDYIYYQMIEPRSGGMDYDDLPFYRIKIDGSNWSDL